ncbi:hypothetical protein PPYC2_16480 [Paenibacillus polymyxa]|uniref:hypothetical protein n=1 Tax=Paenibacillus polymyxa TaxID=1406 RepID=UPI0008FAE806|nr:hypothetical protein [Paenibacillus polymyxa]APB76460.1 hypothetical protein PPYC2_16480 [Paenibacillus polymyxa]
MKHVFKNIMQIMHSIDILMEKQLTPSVLILIYSAMDIVSSLSVRGDRDSQKKDFIAWVDRYLTPKLQTCTGSDLYAARCSVVHTLGSESSMSREGKAKNVVYVWGNESPDKWQSISNLTEYRIVVIKIEDLIYTFRQAVGEFFELAQKDEELLQNVKIRSQKMFSDENIFREN